MTSFTKSCVILDLDGTVYLGDIPITGTIDFIKRNWEQIDFYFLSNNTSKAPNTYIKKLHGLGIPARLEQLLSPTTQLVAYLRKHAIQRAYLVGNTDYAAALQAAMPELTFTETDADIVILAYDTELTYHKLCVSARLLQNAAVAFVATHPDLVCPAPGGSLPDVGSFIALYEKATGRTPEHIFGKPDPKVLEPLPQQYSPESMVMVGDRLATDKKLAENAGIDFILVLSGEATREDAAKEARQPWKIMNDLGEIADI